MGRGKWTTTSFVDYSHRTGKAVTDTGNVTSNNLQDFYKQHTIHDDLVPYKKIRECCDGEDHPATIPVILALDVTGSMGSACIRTAQKLNEIMTSLYNEIPDVEFMIMGIGDLAYDKYPIQASQFEADVRIAEAVDRVYMEHGGGGNSYESYTAAWYFGLHNTALDCWKRGKKGIIITLGDENPNPYLPAGDLSNALGTKIGLSTVMPQSSTVFSGFVYGERDKILTEGVLDRYKGVPLMVIDQALNPYTLNTTPTPIVNDNSNQSAPFVVEQKNLDPKQLELVESATLALR